MKLNVPSRPSPIFTHEGARAQRTGPEGQLRRAVTTCLLWEDNFYESGVSVAERIAALVPKCRPEFCAAVAIEARHKMHIRHAPLLVVREMARATPEHRHLVGKLLPDVITRADELAEFLAIYWKGGKVPVSKQVKTGLRAAFNKFDEYQLSKYNRDGAVKLRDVAFLSHVKPNDPELIARLVNRDFIPSKTKGGHSIIDRTVKNRGLSTPDTWETELSAGKDKKETFTRLMQEGKLGGLAFLRNLRNMEQAGVDRSTIAMYAEMANFKRVLPFRFIAAANTVPMFEDIIEPAMLRALEGRPKLAGHTFLLLDGSESMSHKVSSKSDLKRFDAAAGLAILLREQCERITIGVYNTQIRSIPPRRGFALRDALGKPSGGTRTGAAVQFTKQYPHDRIIVLTDEQSSDTIPEPLGKGYMINVAAYKNGAAKAGDWETISGWSESVVDYIAELESQEAE